MRVYGIAVCMIGIAMTCTAATGQTPSEQQTLDRMKKEFGSVFGRIVISGRVIDGEGKALSGVDLTESHSDLTMSFRTFFLGVEGNDGPQAARSTVSGHFSFDISDTGGVDLSFHKHGYYGKDLSFVYVEPGPNVRIDGRVQYYDIDVVMEKVGDVGPERTYYTSIPISAGKQLKVWVVRESLPGLEGIVKSVTALKDVKGPGLYVRETATKQLELVLGNGGSGEGFKSVVATGATRSERIAGLRRAPATGYEVILPLAITPQGRLKSPVFFYSKIAGLFGKGLVTGVTHDASRGWRINLDLYFALDGTRNVGWPE